MSKDELYKQSIEKIPPFQFNQQVAQVFDNMAMRSIPFYESIQKLIAQIIQEKYTYQGIIYDLGCSTGNTLYSIAHKLDSEKLKLVGIDSSPDMLHQATDKLANYKLKGIIQLKEGDICETSTPDAECFILNYILQFIPKEEKLPFLKQLYDALPTGGFILLSEKIQFQNAKTEALFTQLYYTFKAEQGYSELEIAQKREALESTLTPLTQSQLTTMALEVGFTEVTPFFQWTVFSSFLMVK